MIRTNNQVTWCYLNHQGGTRSADLNLLSRQIFQWAELHLIHLAAVYIQGQLNFRADSLSRNLPSSVFYHLATQVFDLICLQFGIPWLDLFASPSNAMLQVFCSKQWCPQAWVVDALSVPWPRGLLYAFPPIPLLSKVLRKIREERSLVILVPRFGVVSHGFLF